MPRLAIRLLKALSRVGLAAIFVVPICSFAADPVPNEVQTIFDNNCLTNCHQGNTPSGGLSLDDAAISGDALVDVVANCSNNGSKLVEPGDPAVSVLYIKLFPNPNCGNSAMPIGAPLLTDNDRNIIFDWIVSIGPAAQFGLISMEQTTVTVQETDANVTLIVNRELGTTGEITVDFAAAMLGFDTAESPTDFVAQAGTLTFADGETSKQITVVLADDDVFEGSEIFSVTLSNPQNGAVLGGATQTKVSITDDEFDDQPGTFFFGRVSYSTEEDATNMDVTVIRSFGAAGQVSVELSSADGDALSNSDFQAVNSTLIFEEGVKNQTFSVSIIDDDIEESAETFTLRLANPSNGALLGAPQNVTVTINDNDAPASDGGGTGGDTGGDTGGGDAGGDSGGTNEPAEEVEFEAAGSLFYLLPLMLLLGLFGVKARRL